MAGSSKIEWTESTWNPIVGCTIVSPGCKNCYAMRDAWRKHHIPALPHYHNLTKLVNGNPVWTGEVRQAPEHILLKPLKTRKPTVWFVNSMSDLFHESIPDEWIDRVFAVMALCPQHTFQVLTKRAERMREYVSRRNGDSNRYTAQHAIWMKLPRLTDGEALGCKVPPWPLPNVWLGVSAERQQEADERIPHLRDTPAAVRFVSFEPLLGHIDPNLRGIHWVIVGGESGPNARPMHPVWARRIRNVCAEQGVSYFFKQWGGWAPHRSSDRSI